MPAPSCGYSQKINLNVRITFFPQIKFSSTSDKGAVRCHSDTRLLPPPPFAPQFDQSSVFCYSYVLSVRNQLSNLREDSLENEFKKFTFTFHFPPLVSLKFLSSFAKIVYKRLCYQNFVLTFCFLIQSIRAISSSCRKFLDVTFMTLVGVKAAGA